MKQYIGTKIVQAEEMSKKKFLTEKGDFNALQLIKTDIEGYKVTYPDGYISWSPKGVFEEAYRLTDGMNFGLAVEAMKMGKKVARKVYIFNGHTYINKISQFEYANQYGVLNDYFKFEADDILAEDWYILPE